MVTAGLLVGIGMGGFVDGILFHQILQLHEMLSARLPPTSLVAVKVNMVWDGYFHAACWLATGAGVAGLLRAGARRDAAWSPAAFLGSWLAGFGAFNLVEGLIDHEILGLHHVDEYARDHRPADAAFLLSGVVLLAVGSLVVRGAKRRWADVPSAGP